jgi:toxin-antitoxin system PIN domain toxin
VTFLLDVSVLIALIDPTHVAHDAAHLWFADTGMQSWATCPLTENGVIRIVGNPRYANSAGSPAAVIPILVELCALPGHVFWGDDISLLDPNIADASQIATAAQVTDSYLLALATAHGGTLATFDRKLSVKAVRNGRASLHVITG